MTPTTIAALTQARDLIRARQAIRSQASQTEKLAAARWMAEHAPRNDDRMTGRELIKEMETQP